MGAADEIFGEVFAKGPDALVLLDRGEIVLANAQAEKLFGYGPGELIGVRSEDLTAAGRFDDDERRRAQVAADPETRPLGTGLAPHVAPQGRVGVRVGRQPERDPGRDGPGARPHVGARRQRPHPDRGRGAAQGPRRAARAGPPPREPRAAGRRHRPRLQQPARRDPQLHDAARAPGRRIRSPSATSARSAPRPSGPRRSPASCSPSPAATSSTRSRSRSTGSSATPAAMLERTLGEHIELRLDLVDRPVVAVFDRHQLEQIILNLAINSRDAMPDGGVVSITTTAASGPADGPGDVVLSVTDDGPGMTPEVVERVFEPFFSTKPKGEGTGLGLSTVYGIVQQNGGDVAHRLDPGRRHDGARSSCPVRQRVPRRPPAPQPAARRRLRAHPAGGGRAGPAGGDGPPAPGPGLLGDHRLRRDRGTGRHGSRRAADRCRRDRCGDAAHARRRACAAAGADPPGAAGPLHVRVRLRRVRAARAAAAPSRSSSTTCSQPSARCSMAERAGRGRTRRGDRGDVRVLIVDDHRMFAESLARLLGDEDGIEVIGVAASSDGGRRARPTAEARTSCSSTTACPTATAWRPLRTHQGARPVRAWW